MVLWILTKPSVALLLFLQQQLAVFVDLEGESEPEPVNRRR